MSYASQAVAGSRLPETKAAIEAARASLDGHAPDAIERVLAALATRYSTDDAARDEARRMAWPEAVKLAWAVDALEAAALSGGDAARAAAYAALDARAALDRALGFA